MAHLLLPQWRTEVGKNTLLYRASQIKYHWQDPEYSHCSAGRAKTLHWQQQARVEHPLLSTEQLFAFICWQGQEHLFFPGYLTSFVKHRSAFFPWWSFLHYIKSSTFFTCWMCLQAAAWHKDKESPSSSQGSPMASDLSTFIDLALLITQWNCRNWD